MLVFSGANYLRQQALASKIGTVTLSLSAGVAFINDSGQDFSPYVGVSGLSKPYMLVVTDTASPAKKAWGYVGELGTTGETLSGDVLGGAGSFTEWSGVLPNETPSGWIISGTPNSNNYVTQSPAGQCRVVSTDGAINIQVKKTAIIIGNLYYYSYDVKTITGSFNGYLNLPTSVSTSGIKNGYFTGVSTSFIFDILGGGGSELAILQLMTSLFGKP